MGAVLAGAAPMSREACAATAALGTAFQLVDDVLDYDGRHAELGKNVGDDLREGKPTLPLRDRHGARHGRLERKLIRTPSNTVRSAAGRDRGDRASRRGHRRESAPRRLRGRGQHRWLQISEPSVGVPKVRWNWRLGPEIGGALFPRIGSPNAPRRGGVLIATGIGV